MTDFYQRVLRNPIALLGALLLVLGILYGTYLTLSGSLVQQKLLELSSCYNLYLADGAPAVIDRIGYYRIVSEICTEEMVKG